MPRLFVGLLGPFKADLDGTPVVFAYEKTKAILAYLAIQPGRAVRREKLAGLIWPDSSQEAAQEDLRQALSRLRKSLNDSGSFLPYILSDRESIQLNPNADLRVDILQFQHSLLYCATHSHRHSRACPICARQRASAALLYRGEFLEDLSLPNSDLFEDWAATWREQCHIQAVDVFGWLADYHQLGGDVPAALAAARRQVELEPFSEEACLRFLRILAQDGQIEQAIHIYQRFKERLVDELSLSPSQPLLDFVERLRSNTALSDFKQAPFSQGLPVPLTPLIGREVELAELFVWLADPARRLITILGPGGIGKTRLAIAAAQKQAPAFSNGAIFVDFPGLNSRTDFMWQLARALGVTGSEKSDLNRMIIESVKDKDCLLILDGFENALDSTDILNQLLQFSPRLVILITTRERINVPGEWIFPLGGLPFPASGILRQIEKYSAVELFVLQAKQVNPAFELTPENSECISRICRLVGGMPLAIGLASAWVQVMPCHEIADELQRGLDILSSSAAGNHHAGIRAAFEQSWLRLMPEEQRVFRQVTVFRGGFDRQAAQQVTGASVETLVDLVNKSFVRGSAEGRYHIHDLMIQFGLEKLNEAAEFAETYRRHCLYFLETAEKIESVWLTGRDVHSFFWLIKEQDNLHSALNWAIVHDLELAPRLIRCMHADLHRAGVHELRSVAEG
jgi:DNA-binding SARP family transcriptional activator/predicted ATPase